MHFRLWAIWMSTHSSKSLIGRYQANSAIKNTFIAIVLVPLHASTCLMVKQSRNKC